MTHSSNHPRPPFLKGGIDLTKNTKKGGGMEKLLKGSGDPKKRGDSVGKGGILLIWVFF